MEKIQTPRELTLLEREATLLCSSRKFVWVRKLIGAFLGVKIVKNHPRFVIHLPEQDGSNPMIRTWTRCSIVKRSTLRWSLFRWFVSNHVFHVQVRNSLPSPFPQVDWLTVQVTTGQSDRLEHGQSQNVWTKTSVCSISFIRSLLLIAHSNVQVLPWQPWLETTSVHKGRLCPFFMVPESISLSTLDERQPRFLVLNLFLFPFTYARWTTIQFEYIRPSFLPHSFGNYKVFARENVCVRVASSLSIVLDSIGQRRVLSPKLCIFTRSILAIHGQMLTRTNGWFRWESTSRFFTWLVHALRSWSPPVQWMSEWAR